MLNEMPQEIKLTRVESLIFKARLSGLSFSQLPEDRLRWATDQIVTRGAAIAGCELPTTEYFADILSNEIITFMLEYGYGEFTVDEIFTAFRLNASPGMKWPSGIDIELVQFTGCHFNLTFMSKVLALYGTLRGILDRKFQNIIDGY